METQGGAGPKIAPVRPNLMIFGPIACFRRSGSRFSGQKGPRSSEMRVYIGNTRHIKNHQNFKIYFGPGSPKNRFLRFFRNFFTKKWAGNLGISSETTWESRVKRPGPGPICFFDFSDSGSEAGVRHQVKGA